ncbi:hypothetical protein SELMODRAFT_421764 [Selaginella moellendorffii]|uniref:Hyaluronan/mRNA-binding protein domain-containing protein n=1 Tax=Selaginella moellendorffii TaxID=88036 RepID=D8SGA4_SELML|nr:hypothetical protein SELMODRAFT_421764 [Selaginella moellendorffii]
MDQARDVVDQSPIVEDLKGEDHQPNAPHHGTEYADRKNAKKGVERLNRHGGPVGVRAQPKKGGKGGEFTWEGNKDPTQYDKESVPVAIDEKDPNYVDEEQEEQDRKVAAGVVEVAKLAPHDISVIDVAAP